MFNLENIYEFAICRAYEKEIKFKSDPVSAFELASNYEADLYCQGTLILSPLGFEWDENVKLIEKYLGRQGWKETENGKELNLGYKDLSDSEIEIIK